MEARRTYTINEAAGLTGLHKNTVRQRIRLGQLDASIHQGKFGEEYRITHEALVAAGLLPDTGPLDGPGDAAVLDAEFEPAAPTEPTAAAGQGAAGSASTGAAENGNAGIAGLSDLYQRHEQAMFRLGYMQAEMDRLKALAETAESLREDNEVQKREVETLRADLEARAEAAATAERLRADLEAARRQLEELETLRSSVDHLKSLTAEQEGVIKTLESVNKPWWRRLMG